MVSERTMTCLLLSDALMGWRGRRRPRLLLEIMPLHHLRGSPEISERGRAVAEGMRWDRTRVGVPWEVV